MRIHSIRLWDFKSVETTLMWSPAIVLFGRNNAGKTNLLEAIEDSLTWEASVRQDPLVPTLDVPEFEVLIELENRDTSTSDDQLLLASLLQFLEVPPVLEVGPIDRFTSSDQRHTPVTLSWDEHSFTIGAQERLDLEDVIDVIHGEAVGYATSRCASWRDIERDFETVLAACLSSRWLRFGTQDLLRWCAPFGDDIDASISDAAARLLDSAAKWESGVVPILHGACAAIQAKLDEPAPFVHSRAWNVFRPLRVIRVTSTPDRVVALADEVAAWVRRRAEIETIEWGEGGLGLAETEPWLEEHDEGWARVRPFVTELCERISDRATEVAPGFVGRDHGIRVQALSPMHWNANEGQRIRLALVSHSGTEHDMRVVGSGLVVWAGLAIEEALRQLESEEIAETEEGTEWTPTQRTLYVFDRAEAASSSQSSRRGRALDWKSRGAGDGRRPGHTFTCVPRPDDRRRGLCPRKPRA